jgi:hypothetical protein
MYRPISWSQDRRRKVATNDEPSQEKIEETGRRVLEYRERNQIRMRAARRALQEKIKAEGWDDDDVRRYAEGYQRGRDDDKEGEGEDDEEDAKPDDE